MRRNFYFIVSFLFIFSVLTMVLFAQDSRPTSKPVEKLKVVIKPDKDPEMLKLAELAKPAMKFELFTIASSILLEESKTTANRLRLIADIDYDSDEASKMNNYFKWISTFTERSNAMRVESDKFWKFTKDSMPKNFSDYTTKTGDWEYIHLGVTAFMLDDPFGLPPKFLSDQIMTVVYGIIRYNGKRKIVLGELTVNFLDAFGDSLAPDKARERVKVEEVDPGQMMFCRKAIGKVIFGLSPRYEVIGGCKLEVNQIRVAYEEQ